MRLVRQLVRINVLEILQFAKVFTVKVIHSITITSYLFYNALVRNRLVRIILVYISAHWS